MVSTSTVAEIGSLLGDPARVNMVIALLDGRAKTARELADIAGVAPQTASSHLAKLVVAQMIKVDRQGRHRYHRLASSEIARLVEQMHVAGAALAGNSPTPGPRDPAMRELRSCYDHLAGRIAVELGSLLIQPGGEIPGDATLTRAGMDLLRKIGIDAGAIERGRRHFCRTCLDWSERRPHVAGAVGQALLQRFKDLGWVRPRATGRTLDLTPSGQQGLWQAFGIAPSPIMTDRWQAAGLRHAMQPVRDSSNHGSFSRGKGV